MADSTDKTARGPLAFLCDRPTGTTPPSTAQPSEGTAARPATPTRLGHYIITRKLGQGGMGVVYEARDERVERTVALKRWRPVTTRHAKRMWREVALASALDLDIHDLDFQEFICANNGNIGSSRPKIERHCKGSWPVPEPKGGNVPKTPRVITSSEGVCDGPSRRAS